MDIVFFRDWLSTCPHITAPVSLEYLEAVPGATALFSAGNREVSRCNDVAGNVWVTCRSSFSLLRRVPRLADGAGYAQWLLDLQAWIQHKCIRGETPQVGALVVCVQAQNGHLQRDTADSMGVYKVALDVEYVKMYPAK